MYEVNRRDAYTDLSMSVTVLSGVKKTCSSTIHWQVLYGFWLAPVVVEGIHVEDIF